VLKLYQMKEGTKTRTVIPDEAGHEAMIVEALKAADRIVVKVKGGKAWKIETFGCAEAQISYKDEWAEILL